MKAIVRDDIISLSSFVAAEFKYKYYLETLKESGNYCFLDQFKKLVPKGQSIVNGMLEHNLIALENINKNYKYIYLTDTAMKYLYLRESDEDFENVTKNRISVKKVNKNPSEKQLLTSAYKFHLMITEDPLISKQDVFNSFSDFIYLSKIKHNKDYVIAYLNNQETKIQIKRDEIKTVQNELSNFESIIQNLFDSSMNDTGSDISAIKKVQEKLELLKSKEFEKAGLFNKQDILIQTKDNEKEIAIHEERLNNLQQIASMKSTLIKKHNILHNQYTKKINNLKDELDKIVTKYENSKNSIEELNNYISKVHREIEKLYDISKVIVRIVDSRLELLIFDTGSFKTAFGYLKIINSLNEFKIPIEHVKIVIYSYVNHRSLNLENEFNKLKKDKLNALNTIKNYNIKTNDYYPKPDFYIAADNLYKSIPDFELEIRDTFYYMKKYKEITSAANKYIKKRDKEAIDLLIQKLNS
ncbi:MAG: hypothetical protein ACRC1T_03355 [Clostridium chrysemydis]|uniref:hypothetical protein n=1 Tax=Clostridium chrysemydis TaxID=2665504 RepID=UPI003F33C6E7